MACQRGRHFVDETGLVQLAARDVDRHPNPAAGVVCPRPGLAAGLVQRPATEFDDQPGVLGEFDELQRRDQAALGVPPAQQRFGPADPPVGQGDDRLVVQEELTGLHRPLKVGAAGEPVEHPGVQVVVVAHHLALAAFLGGIERQVRAAQQLGQGEGGGVSTGQDQPGAGVHPYRLAVQQERAVERAQDPARERLGLGRVGDFFDEQRELVAAEPGGRVAGAKIGLEPARYLLEQLVTGAVAAAVVDTFEVVEVDHDHRQQRVVPLPPAQRVRCPVPEQHPVGQPGQPVVERLVLELFFQRAPV